MKQRELSIYLAGILKSIANPIRLQCLCCLLDGEKSVSELLNKVNISQSALSQHLILLKDRGFLRDKKVGKFIYYSIANQQILEILRFLKSICNNGVDN